MSDTNGAAAPPPASPTATPAPAAAPSPAAPTASSPAPAPAAVPPQPATPAVAAEPSSAPSTPVAAGVESPAPSTETSLVSEPAPAKTAEAPVEPAKPAEAKPAEAPTEPAPKNFVYQPFTLPEGVNAPDAERMTEFQKILTEAAPSNEVAQTLGQKLVDFHIAEIQRMSERQQALQNETWKKTNNDWRDQVRADPEIGGNRLDTVLSSVRSLVAQFGGNEAEVASLRQAFDMTGAGNHPAVIRFLSRIGKALGEGRPVAAQIQPMKPVTRSERRYGPNGTGNQPQTGA